MLLSIALIALFAPQSPDPTLPPANAHVIATAVGLGVQIYRCAAPSDAPTNFQWTYEAPEATLFDPSTHQPVGTHGVGPKWTWKDGSEVSGKVVQKRTSEVPGSVPWLLLETHSTSIASGELTEVTLVRRSDTQAGAAPATGCDAIHQNTVLRVPYQATYTFYTTSESLGTR
jgi:hypothetical protein